jgi:hypothetical protein
MKILEWLRSKPRSMPGKQRLKPELTKTDVTWANDSYHPAETNLIRKKTNRTIKQEQTQRDEYISNSVMAVQVPGQKLLELRSLR